VEDHQAMGFSLQSSCDRLEVCQVNHTYPFYEWSNLYWILRWSRLGSAAWWLQSRIATRFYSLRTLARKSGHLSIWLCWANPSLQWCNGGWACHPRTSRWTRSIPIVDYLYWKWNLSTFSYTNRYRHLQRWEQLASLLMLGFSSAPFQTLGRWYRDEAVLLAFILHWNTVLPHFHLCNRKYQTYHCNSLVSTGIRVRTSSWTSLARGWTKWACQPWFHTCICAWIPSCLYWR